MKLDPKQKRIALIGAAIVVVLYIFLRGAGAKQPAPQAAPIAPQSGMQPTDLSPLTSLLQAVVTGLADSQQALAGITQNQISAVLPQLQALGAQSWLACLPAGGAKPDAMCIKAKGGVNVAGLPDVSGVKTGDVFNYIAPYSACKKVDLSYDLTCVGNLIAGQPNFNTALISTAPGSYAAATRSFAPANRAPLVR